MDYTSQLPLFPPADDIAAARVLYEPVRHVQLHRALLGAPFVVAAGERSAVTLTISANLTHFDARDARVVECTRLFVAGDERIASVQFLEPDEEQHLTSALAVLVVDGAAARVDVYRLLLEVGRDGSRCSPTDAAPFASLAVEFDAAEAGALEDWELGAVNHVGGFDAAGEEARGLRPAVRDPICANGTDFRTVLMLRNARSVAVWPFNTADESVSLLPGSPAVSPYPALLLSPRR